jgi:hypothetical protein
MRRKLSRLGWSFQDVCEDEVKLVSIERSRRLRWRLSLEMGIGDGEKMWSLG